MALRLFFVIFITFIITSSTCERTRLKEAMEDREQQALSEQSKSSNLIIPGLQVATSNSISTPGRAITESRQGFGREFAGIEVEGQIIKVHAKVHIHQPKVAPHHSSSAYVAIESGSGNRFNQIQVGWTVNPDLYGDNRVRFFTKWTGDNNTGCYDTRCKGFTQVSDVRLGGELTASNPAKNIQRDLSIYLEQEWDRDWWLYIRPDRTKVGYWDRRCFSSLSEVATTTRFGGEVFTPKGSDSSPPMGSGLFEKSYDNYATCYFSDILVNDDVPGKDARDVKVLQKRCYFVGKIGNFGPQGFGFLFGGVGGRDMESCSY